MLKHQLIRVLLPGPLRQHFDYLLDTQLDPVLNGDPLLSASQASIDDSAATPHQVKLIGLRVLAPFGRGKRTGIITALPDSTDCPPEKLKFAQLIDSQPAMTDSLQRLCLWAANYYHHPAGDVLFHALPILLRKGQPNQLPQTIHWQLTERGKKVSLNVVKRAKKQLEVMQQLHDLMQQESPDSPASQTIDEQLLRPAGQSRQPLLALAEKGWIESIERPAALDLPEEAPSSALTLSEEQQFAVDSINTKTQSEDKDKGHFAAFLLEGVTGSGKTEVYLQAIETVVAQGKQALVLVPEIGLTPQTLQRFRARFRQPVVVLHSGLTDTARLRAWQAASNGEAAVIIGTRSAIFTPMQSPGLIIVDEEHDNSYKQMEGFRYHARDLAVVRARMEKIPVVLGSATPALESLHNANTDRYQLLKLTHRASDAKEPTKILLDIRSCHLQSGLSPTMRDKIRATLENNQQVLLFLNRRGFSPVLMCHDCGWLAQCPSCDAKMALHQNPHRLHCHHCDNQRRLPETCPDCKSENMVPVGLGTERLEQELAQTFDDWPVLRVDRDSTRKKGSLDKILQQINAGEPMILLGTQMLAKGHHFPKVTLVGILDVDGAFFSGDFRAGEKLAQLVTQVAGRAGRGELAGEVCLQSRQPEHPQLQGLLKQGYNSWAQQELELRQQALLPPFSHMAMLRAEAINADSAKKILQPMADCLKQISSGSLMQMGPLAAPMEKRANRYRQQLLIQADDRRSLHQAMAILLNQPWLQPANSRYRWSIDIDPQDLY